MILLLLMLHGHDLIEGGRECCCCLYAATRRAEATSIARLTLVALSDSLFVPAAPALVLATTSTPLVIDQHQHQHHLRLLGGPPVLVLASWSSS
jgi:hypothetical protein